MKKIVFISLVIGLCSCSTGHWVTSDSDAFLEYDRVNHRYQIIWTWKLKKGREHTDTVIIRPTQSDNVKVTSSGEGTLSLL